MKIILLTVLFSMTAAVGLCATSAAGEARKQEILAAEKARIAALVSDDYAALDRILADDMTYAHSSGVVETKTQFLNELRSGRLKYKALDHSNQTVRIYGDAAILSGTTKVHAVSAGADVRPTLHFTTVYVRQNGMWRLASWQSTRLPD